MLKVTGDAAPATLRCKTRAEGDTVFEFVLENESRKSEFGEVQIHWAFCCDSNDPASAADLDGHKIIVLHLLSYERLWVEYDGPYWMRLMLIPKGIDDTNTKYRRVGILYSDVSGHFVPSKVWREMENRYELPPEEAEDAFLKKFRNLAREQTVQLV